MLSRVAISVAEQEQTLFQRSLYWKSNSNLPNFLFYLLQWKSFKIDKLLSVSSQKLFSFSRYLNFCLDFFFLKGKVHIKIHDVTTFTMHVLPKISRSKGNQTIKIGQLIEYKKRNIFPPKSCREWGREVSSKCLVFFQKAFYEVNVSGLQLRFNIFQYPSTWCTIK